MRAQACCALVLCLAAGAPPRAAATMDGAALADLVKSKKLGLSPEETQTAMARLRRGTAPRDMNRSISAKAAKGLAFLPTHEEGRSPFDGGEALPLRGFEGSVARLDGHAIDEESGERLEMSQEMIDFVSLQEEGKLVRAPVSVSGACPSQPSMAISTLQSLVKSKVESGAARGDYADFFLYLYLLFFSEKYKEQLPTISSGQTQEESTIATFEHTGRTGFMLFDCEKYKDLGPALQRKIACHEFYHQFSPETGEQPAYDVMSRC